MKLGILSDSHGKIDPVRQAVQVLETAGAEAIVHCGDVGGIEVLEELAGRQAWFVWGNMDFVRPTWQAEVLALDLPWPDGPLQLRLNGKHLAIFHGHEPGFRAALHEARYDYLLHGHSHRCEDYRIRAMRVVNPGALHRAQARTVALLNLQSDAVEFITLDHWVP